MTNPSYFAPGYFKVFASYTGDTRWNQVADATYQIIATLDAKTGAGTTGLLPDWTRASGDPASGMGFNYTYDACRAPWRLAVDAAWFGEIRAASQLNHLNAFWAGVGSANIKDGYTLDGHLIRQWHNSAFVAMAASGAIVSTDTSYKNAMWNETVAQSPNQGYYHDTLRLLALLFMSGHMPNPLDGGTSTQPGDGTTSPATGAGSIQQEGIYTFSTNSDDGSRLFIGNTLVADNDGLHPAQEVSGTIGLKAGQHAIRVEFFQRGGGYLLEVRYAGPSVPKQLIPDIDGTSLRVGGQMIGLLIFRGSGCARDGRGHSLSKSF